VGKVTVRKGGDFLEVDPEVHYMDVSPKQLVSVAAGLIPFLEHDDANRALMGSNMQRQGVPLLKTEAPLVGTGIESRVARDSKTVVVGGGRWHRRECRCPPHRRHQGRRASARLRRKPKSDPKKGILRLRAAQVHALERRHLLQPEADRQEGPEGQAGEVIADGPHRQGRTRARPQRARRLHAVERLQLRGRHLISEKVLKDDVYTSIHIEEFEVTARDTKLGPEEITRDIPNVGEEALKNLNHDGVIRIGAEVKPGDILVGKITPKSETELAPEEKLLRAIFGEKAADVKDTSLVVPSGVAGIIMDVKVSSRVDSEQAEKLSPSDRRRQIKQINEEYRTQMDKLREGLTEPSPTSSSARRSRST
jgi:DNA-directed RNA polymerase subunit beta